MATRLVWVTRDVITPRHIEGLLEGLRQADALDYAELRIIALTDEASAHIPAGTTFNGQTLPGGTVTVDNLPPQGLLFATED